MKIIDCPAKHGTGACWQYPSGLFSFWAWLVCVFRGHEWHVTKRTVPLTPEALRLFGCDPMLGNTAHCVNCGRRRAA